MFVHTKGRTLERTRIMTATGIKTVASCMQKKILNVQATVASCNLAYNQAFFFRESER